MAGLEEPPPAAALESHWVDTPVGKLEVKLQLPAGERATALAVFVHGKNPAPGTIWEWSFLLEPLRERKVAQVYANLHSCERTNPRFSVPEAVVAALDAVIAWTLARCDGGASTPVVLYGKSWGGAQAIELAAKLCVPDDTISCGAKLAGLCLACPASPEACAEKVQAIPKVPTLLTWAKDDPVIPFTQSEQLLAELRGRGPTIWVPVDEGGHNVARMSNGFPGLATKLADWPDLVQAMAALAGGGVAGAGCAPSTSGGGGASASPQESGEEEAKPSPPAARAGAFDLSGMM